MVARCVVTADMWSVAVPAIGTITGAPRRGAIVSMPDAELFYVGLVVQSYPIVPTHAPGDTSRPAKGEGCGIGGRGPRRTHGLVPDAEAPTRH